jgi:hypothetical protein
MIKKWENAIYVLPLIYTLFYFILTGRRINVKL